MGRKVQEDLIFAERIFHCNICNTDNVYFLIVKPFGQAVWGGAVCEHADKTKIGQRVTRIDAEQFLKVEKREAEDLCTKADVSTKESLHRLISEINTALVRMHVNF